MIKKKVVFLIGMMALSTLASCGRKKTPESGSHAHDSEAVSSVKGTESNGPANSSNVPVHEHTFSSDWSSDETNHWHAATCEHTNERKDVGVHTWGEWAVKTAAKCEEAGVKARKCSVCQYEQTEEIPATGHSYNTTKWKNDAEKHWHQSTCDHDLQIDEAPHDWSDWEVVTAATCTEKGERKRHCTVCNYEAKEEIAALGHNATDKTHVCSRCNFVTQIDIYYEKHFSLRTADDFISTVKLSDEQSNFLKIAVESLYSSSSDDEKTNYEHSDIIPANTNINLRTSIEKKNSNSACIIGGHGAAEKTKICYNDGTPYTPSFYYGIMGVRVEVAIKSADHSFGEWVTTKEATCAEEGAQTRTCSVCGFTQTEVLPKSRHNLQHHVAVAATCTSAGNKEYWSCATCHKYFSDAAGENEVDASWPTLAATAHKNAKWTLVSTPSMSWDESTHKMVYTNGFAKKTCPDCGAVLVNNAVVSFADGYERRWDPEKEVYYLSWLVPDDNVYVGKDYEHEWSLHVEGFDDATALANLKKNSPNVTSLTIDPPTSDDYWYLDSICAEDFGYDSNYKLEVYKDGVLINTYLGADYMDDRWGYQIEEEYFGNIVLKFVCV